MPKMKFPLNIGAEHTMQLEIATLSKMGGRSANEDACDYWSTPEVCCCVLSDGLGGHYGGDVASKLVVMSVLDAFQKVPECNIKAVEALLRVGDDAIIQEQERNIDLKYMRATAVILIIDIEQRLAAWGHVGDSRLYCFRRGRVVMQTRDHSVSQRMIDAGYMKPEALRLSPQRNQLIAALGNNKHFDVDITPTELPLQHHDVFLLCSDGLWEYVQENEMEQMLNLSGSASQWLEAMEKQVLARGHEGQDNYSAIALWCHDLDETTLFPN